MKRGEAIEQLRPFVSNLIFNRITDLPTANLKGMVAFYLAGGIDDSLIGRIALDQMTKKGQEEQGGARRLEVVDIVKQRRNVFMERLTKNVLTQ